MFKRILAFLTVGTILLGTLTACGPTASDKEAQTRMAELNRTAKGLISQAGWVHVRENIVYDTDKQDRGTISNGKLIPLVQVVDIWYHTNEQKLVYEFVWMLTTQDGEPILENVFRKETLYNLTTNYSSALSPYSLSLDYQFADELDAFISRNGHPTMTTGEINGKTAVIFTIDEKLDAPSTNEDFNQPVMAAGTIAYFDAETGLLLKLVRTVTLEDGSTRTFYNDDLVIETGVEPTLDVQLYVNGMW